MIVRMKISLEQANFSGLLKLALTEMRTPESQLVYILRKELNLHYLTVEKNDSGKDLDNSIKRSM